jgi:hypothetical protein
MSPKALAPVAARFTVAAGLMLAAGGACAGVAGAWPQPTPPPVPPLPSAGVAGAGPTSTPPRPPGPITTIDHDGTYAVGTEVVPGIYSSAGPVGDGTCYWKRTGNPDGALIDNALSKKPQVVRIDPTDKAFKTTGCQPWQQTPDANPPADAPAPLGGDQLQLTLGTLNGLLGPNGQPPPNGPQPAPGPPPPNGPQPPQP